MKAIFMLFIVCIWWGSTLAQDDLAKLFDDSTSKEHVPVIATFKSFQIINAQSNETVHKQDLLFVVGHRFGDVAGTNGGIKNFFGLDNSSDILIAFDYGISDKLSVGIGRAKGAANGVNTDQKQLFYLNLKYRLLQQTMDNYIPISVTLFGNGLISTMEKSEITTSDANFQEFNDRMAYLAQAIIARKFNDQFSLAFLPTYLRRNFVPFMDMNNMFALGVGGRLKVNKSMAIVADYFYPFRSQESKNYFEDQKGFKFYNPLGIGFEIETGGHVFNVGFTNATAILDNQFIPSTSSSWTNGEFRWGFSITRTFSFGDNNID
jgi:hypothetical protein